MSEPANPLVIYTTRLCGYCAMARRLLDSKGAQYEERRVDFDSDLRREMESRSGRRTVPQIFAGNAHLGGFDDIARLDQTGELDALLGLSA